MSDEPNNEMYNEVKQWAASQRSMLQAEIRKLSSKGKGELAKALRFKVYKNKLGVVSMVGFQFPRHGVFMQKGVGRGYIMEGGVVVRGSRLRTSKQIKLYANAKNRDIQTRVIRSGAINRHPEDWFNTPISNNIDKIADIVAKYMADANVNATHTLIN
ncbi:MAG: hypothetical protein WCY05_04160 [Candidatus Omnitrophota bacterium]